MKWKRTNPQNYSCYILHCYCQGDIGEYETMSEIRQAIKEHEKECSWLQEDNPSIQIHFHMWGYDE